MRNSELFKILNREKIPYTIVEGEYDVESYKIDNKFSNVDIDVVLQTNSKYIMTVLKESGGFDYLGGHSFKDKKYNIRLDLYFFVLNVGYYTFLKVNHKSFINKTLSKEEYIIYNLLDPLLKFSKYYPRHQYRLAKYFAVELPQEVRIILDCTIGRFLSNILLNKVKNNDFRISRIFIKICKFRLLFINGNFVNMLKSRLF